jgi:hypothetical protein
MIGCERSISGSFPIVCFGIKSAASSGSVNKYCYQSVS